MQFERRDLVLAAASVMFMLGLAPFIGIAYALAVAFMLYFGTKVLVGRRRRQLLDSAGEGLCAECGARLEGGGCPACGPPGGPAGK